jgi:hypothetical protein
VIMKANADSEAWIPPPPGTFEAMGAYNQQLLDAGVLLGGEGLLPSSRGVRLDFTGDEPAVTEGPFPETDQLVAGFWIIQSASREEAIDWVKRCPYRGENPIEVRQIAELEDFGDAVTPEVRDHEERMRSELDG